MPRGVPNKKPDPDFTHTADTGIDVTVPEPRFGAHLGEPPVVQMQAEEPEVVQAMPEAEQVVEEPAAPPQTFADGWAGMDAAPKNGRTIYAMLLTDFGVPVIERCYWRITRQWKGTAARWVETGYWAREFGTIDHGLEPSAWHPDHFGLDPRL